MELSVDGVVFLRLELPSPSVETKVEQGSLSISNESYETVVASPSVVGVDVHYSHVFHGFFADVPLAESLLYCLSRVEWMRSDHDESLALGYLGSHVDIGLCYVFKRWCPVGVGVRPCQLHRLLRFPFCGQPQCFLFQFFFFHILF